MTGLVRALVACYPPAWRRRYGEEYAQLLRDLRVHRRPALVVDSLFGAVRAHGGALMSRRSPMTSLVWAAGLFTVAGLAFAKLAEDFHGQARASYAVLVVAATVALLALAVAAAPALRDRHAWKYAVVPLAGTALWYGTVRLTLALSTGRNAVGFVVVAAAGTLVVGATAWAASAALRRAPVASGAAIRVVAAAGMGLATIAALAWGLQVRSLGGSGFLAGPFLPSWIGVVVALAAATALAGSSARYRTAAGHS